MNRAKKELDACGSQDCDAARQIFRLFPELKESEDEEIKEMLKVAVERTPWMQDKKEKCYEWLEAQGEQKPADKVEPKFKVGDFLVSDYCIGKVVELTNDAYLLDTGQGIPFSCEHNAHLWTIQDAKDGDVLTTDLWLFMFKYTNNKDLIQFHCKCPINETPYKWCWLSDDSYLDIYIDANIHPATKEQRDLLFQKMKEAGYEWDAEKKELKKIKQNPAWSEEDEKCIENAIMYCKWARDIAPNLHCYEISEKSINWLKSIKDRVQPQPKQEWSEEDKDYYDAIIAKLEVTQDDALLTDNQMEFLKTLKDRYTWKPSNEQIEGIECTIKTLKYQLNCGDNRLDSLYNDLKKLRGE